MSADARELYALPLLVPLALVAAPASDTLRRGAANLIYWFSVMGCGFFIIVAWFYWGALELGVPARLHAHLHRIQPGYTPGFRWLPFIFGALYSAAWIALMMRLRKSRERTADRVGGEHNRGMGTAGDSFHRLGRRGQELPRDDRRYAESAAGQIRLHREQESGESRSARCCITSPASLPGGWTSRDASAIASS
jgi:hypothetical protein